MPVRSFPALVSARIPSQAERFGIALNLRQEVIGNEGAPFIPALLLDWNPFGRVVFKASVARNYRFPTLNDRHFAKNTLLPEEGFTYDGGVEAEGSAEGASYGVSLTFYDSYIRNWIFWYPDKGATQWLPTNIRLVHAFGAEASARAAVEWGRGWSARVDALLAWTRSLNMQRTSERSRQCRRKTAALCTCVVGRRDGAAAVAVVDGGLQVELLQRTLHHDR